MVASQHAASKTSAMQSHPLYDIMFMNIIKCGYYLKGGSYFFEHTVRAATIRGAGTIRINTVN